MRMIALTMLALSIPVAIAGSPRADCVFTGKWTNISPGDRPIFKCDDDTQ
jgi:hypothetical protein